MSNNEAEQTLCHAVMMGWIIKNILPNHTTLSLICCSAGHFFRGDNVIVCSSSWASGQFYKFISTTGIRLPITQDEKQIQRQKPSHLVGRGIFRQSAAVWTLYFTLYLQNNCLGSCVGLPQDTFIYKNTSVLSRISVFHPLSLKAQNKALH